MKMTKGDAILRLLTEIKLELKETKEAIEKLDERIAKIEKQTLPTNLSKPALNNRKEKDWKYPSKMK
ncbi:hypothetical protein BF15_06875 [Bacillus thuringiensis]|uniref:Preprotein translocase n=3 Tax=Bacillus cereus group TaxID=86661 RepID=A0AAW4HZS9_BACTU|nr:hypothetical protein [Bacillus thuringiensis]EXY04782.1 hypothetical protein BF15_06875 [Bacillus thuringiensis]MBN9901195.1 hypothetical protein [Bacillus thuringiensis]MDY7521576.1 hypothetical protein [Bacillus thuringiensis]